MNSDAASHLPRSLARFGPRLPSFLLFGIVSLALLVSGVALVQSLNAERAFRERVALTTLVLNDLRSVQRLVTDAETGQRGYILTGDEDYLTPYRESAERLPDALNRLEQRLEPVLNSEQDRLLEQLEQTADYKMLEMAKTIRLYDAGREDEALRLIRSNAGRGFMLEIRSIISRLEAIEDRIVTDAQDRVAATERQALPLLATIALFIVLALGLGLWQILRMVDVEVELREMEDLRERRARSDLLNRELNHRVKNVFAVVSSLAGTTLRKETDPAVAAQKFQERIRALAIAHDVTQGSVDRPMVDLSDLVEAALRPYDHYADRLSIDGEPVQIDTSALTPLGLVLHELATNALKYGAWSGAAGNVLVKWEIGRDGTGQRQLDLNWIETGVHAMPTQFGNGFGTRMLSLAANQLNGEVERNFREDGLAVSLRFPLGEEAALDEAA